MFHLIAQSERQPLGGSTGVPVVLSIAGHVALLGLMVGLPLMYATDTLPKVPAMMTFVADLPAPPPPPPPAAPAPAAPRSTARPPEIRRSAPLPASAAVVAPLEAPSTVEPERSEVPPAFDEGGVAGGLDGGIAGGIVGGLVAAPPPPPPPAVVQPRTPVRVGGNLQTPALLKRVEPVYPDVALMAKVSGMVILEAVVGEDGSVQSVKVLRSVKLLDNAAIDAVMQWKYSPLVLNGVRTPFVATVTLNFGFHAQ